MKRIAVIFVFVAAAFAYHARAASLEQLDYASSTSCATAADGGVSQGLGQSLYGTMDQGVQITFTPCDTGNYGVAVTLTEEGTGVVRSETLTTDFSAGVPVQYSFTVPQGSWTFDYYKAYTVEVVSASTTAGISVNGSLSTSSYPNGAATHSTPGYENGVADIYFSIPNVGYTPGASIASGSISLTQPTDGSTTYEFNFFEIKATSTTLDPLVGVRYGSSSSIYTYEDFTQESFVTTTPFTSFVYKKHTLVQSVNQERVWYFKAFLYDQWGNVIASSSEVAAFIKFSLLNINTPTTTAPTSTDYFFIERVCPDAETFFSSTTLSAAVCHITNAFRQLGNEVFAGSEAVLNSALSVVKSIFPISVFVHIQNDFDNPTIASSTSNVKIPFNGKELTIFTSSTFDQFSAQVGYDWRSFGDKVLYFFTGIIMLVSAVLAVAFMVHSEKNG